MSTEQSPEPVTPSTPEVDWFLQSLVSMANTSSFEIGITLQVGGLLVSGSLVSGKQYFQGFGEDLAGPFADEKEVAEKIKKLIGNYGDTIYSDAIKDDPASFYPQYIHLKNARFFNTAGNPIPQNQGVWWRGRLCEVGGVVLGTLGQSK